MEIKGDKKDYMHGKREIESRKEKDRVRRELWTKQKKRG